MSLTLTLTFCMSPTPNLSTQPGATAGRPTSSRRAHRRRDASRGALRRPPAPAPVPVLPRTRIPTRTPIPLPVPLSPSRTPIPYPTLTAYPARNEALFEAFAGIARIYAACGPTMMIVAKNDQASGRARARFRLGPNPNPPPHLRLARTLAPALTSRRTTWPRRASRSSAHARRRAALRSRWASCCAGRWTRGCTAAARRARCCSP